MSIGIGTSPRGISLAIDLYFPSLDTIGGLPGLPGRLQGRLPDEPEAASAPLTALASP